MDILLWLFSNFVKECNELFSPLQIILFGLGFFFSRLIFGWRVHLVFGFDRHFRPSSRWSAFSHIIFLTLLLWTFLSIFLNTLSKGAINDIFIASFSHSTRKLSIEWMEYSFSWSLFFISVANDHRGNQFKEILLNVRLIDVEWNIALIWTKTFDNFEWVDIIIFQWNVLVLFDCLKEEGIPSKRTFGFLSL